MATAEIIGIGTGIIVDLGIRTGGIGKMKLFLSLVILLVFMGISSVAIAVEIDPEPFEFHPWLEGDPPPNYSDESSYHWIPKGDLGITFAQATKGLEGVIPKVIRWRDPPGFQGNSSDGKIYFFMWGNEQAIKTIRLKVPFCVDPYRFSLGSYSDMESATKILTSCLDGAFPSYNGSENREWVERFIGKLMNRPLRNAFMDNKVETQDGCVLFKKIEPVVRMATDKAEITLSCDLFGHEFTLEITPPRKTTGGATTSTDKTKGDQTDTGLAKGLGVSYDQLMVGMKPFFPKMEFNPLPEPNYYGRSDYGGLDYASYSIYGKDKSNSLRVSLYAPLKRPWPKERMMKTAHILSTCLHNAVPEWKNEAERTEWLGSSVESMIHNPSSLNNSTNPDSNKEFARDYGSKRIKLQLKIGWVILTVDPRSDD
jgi:hypothetical protein